MTDRSPAPDSPPRDGDSRGATVIITEDELLVAEDLRQHLIRRGYHVLAVHTTAEETLASVAQVRPDLVLMDIRLDGELDGVEAARLLRERHALPVVFLTSHADEDTLARAAETRPNGYLVKPFQEDELHATLNMALFRDRAESRLRKLDAWLLNTLESIGDAVIATDRDGRVLYVNPVAEQLTGCALERAVGVPARELLAFEGNGRDPVDQVFRTGATATIGLGARLLGAKEQRTPVRGTAAPVRDNEGAMTGVVVVLRDCTEEERLQARLVETQKLESLGVLAGGVAHDFNNLLTSMLGNVSLVRNDLPAASEHRAMLEDVEEAAGRAAGFCKQMLAYSGHGHFVLKRVHLNRLIEDNAELIEAALGKGTTLRLELDTDLPPVQADPSQMYQVLINLVTNAAEAIGRSTGEVGITTGTRELDAAFLADLPGAPAAEPGRFVVVSVSDTGEGMDADTLARIFEPFYTTKFVGRGLGLPAVLGIARGHGGAIAVESRPEAGTTCSVFLPVDPSHATPAAASEPTFAATGRGQVLVIDDEESVRVTTSRILRRMGFEVVAAADGEEGLRCYRERADELALVLLDLTMPRMDGESTLREIRALRADVPVLLVSGYNEQTALERLRGLRVDGFIQKPFLAPVFMDLINRFVPPDTPAEA